MSIPELESIFPNLLRTSYQITSPKADAPNCIGWALHSELYFDPGAAGFTGGYYWPPGIRRDDSLEAWVELFALFGYSRCESADLEPGHEKIAIYADSTGDACHVALQLPSGAWSSKLGKLEDIQHQHPDALAGNDYGSIVTVMRRPLA